MLKTTYSAKKHGFTDADALWIITTAIHAAPVSGRQAHPAIEFIGYAENGQKVRLLAEIHTTHWTIFHMEAEND